MKFDIKIYGIEERQDNILKNKEILGLSDNDIIILKKEDRVTPQDRYPQWYYHFNVYPIIEVPQ